MQDVLDYKHQHWLRTFIRSDEFTSMERHQLRNIARCGEVIPNQDNPILLLSNGENAALWGQHTCKNSFACPVCSARIMLKHRTKIACAIEALKAQGLCGVMVTFVLPHLRMMRCKETVDILYNTWRTAFLNKSAKRIGKTGGTRYASPINRWYVESEVKYNVRVSEYTWGENGWNPHFHVIFWMPRSKVDIFRSFESEIEKYWAGVARKETAKYWQKNNLHGNAAEQEKLLAKVFWAQDAGYMVKFSKNEVQTSDYVAGWGADKEMTGTKQKKASHSDEGHFSPFEILSYAVKDKIFTGEFAHVYKEFMLNVTRKPVHRRIEYSKGLHAIIIKFQQTEKYHEFLAKKNATPAKWEVVCWFTASDWSKLCSRSVINDEPIIWLILSAVPKLWRESHIKTWKFLDMILADYGITAHFLPRSVEEFATNATNSFNHVAA